MANLIKCKDCNREMSKSAKSCPHCGSRTFWNPWKDPKEYIFAIILLVIIAFLYNFFKSSENDIPESVYEDPDMEKLYLERSYKRLEKQNESVKSCVKTLGKGVYKNKSLEWKLDSCHASK